MARDDVDPPSSGSIDPRPRWPPLRIAAWALIAVAGIGFVLAGDVRTNWVIGEVTPEQGEVALPRLATLALMAGLVLLCWHQVRSRRRLPTERYRGPAILAVVALSVGLSVALLLPWRTDISIGIEGGVPSLIPVIAWTIAAKVATAFAAWLVHRTQALAGYRPFRDPTAIRHALVGVAVGGLAQIAIIAGGLSIASMLTEARLQITGTPLPGLMLPGQPLWLGVVGSVVLAPVTEEFLYRGTVLQAWRREYGVPFALAGSAALFGLVHYGLNPIEFLPDELPWLIAPTTAGLVLGALALRTGSLIAPIFAHATMNAVPFLLALSLGPPLA